MHASPPSQMPHGELSLSCRYENVSVGCCMETSLRRLPDWDADLMIYHSSIDLALHATAGDSQSTSYKWCSVVLSSPRLLAPARVETRISPDYRGGRIAPPLPATSRTTS